jgi:hypothetical protein
LLTGDYMASIAIQDLYPSGHDLFMDDESYLKDLSPDEELSVSGGLVQWLITVSTGACAGAITVAAVTYASYIAYTELAK